MSLPSYAVDFRDHPACPCLAEWLPVFESELQRRGLLDGPLHIYQLIGGYSGSGGTHTDGGAFDLLDLPGTEDQRLARDMGADATWARPYNWDGNGGIAHTHGVLRGCPHNGPARYQYDSTLFGVDHDRDGLSHGGRGAPDTGPRPLSDRTWREGIQWAKAQAQEAEDMQLTDEFAKDKSVRDLFRRLDKFITRQDGRQKKALEEIEALPVDGATKADVRRIVTKAFADDDADA